MSLLAELAGPALRDVRDGVVLLDLPRVLRDAYPPCDQRGREPHLEPYEFRWIRENASMAVLKMSEDAF